MASAIDRCTRLMAQPIAVQLATPESVLPSPSHGHRLAQPNALALGCKAVQRRPSLRPYDRRRPSTEGRAERGEGARAGGGEIER